MSLQSLHEVEKLSFYDRDDVFAASDYFVEQGDRVIAIAGVDVVTVALFSYPIDSEGNLHKDTLMCMGVIDGTWNLG